MEKLTLEQKVILHLAKKGLISGDLEIEGVGETCAHEPLTNEEIQEVFDNDNEEVNS